MSQRTEYVCDRCRTPTTSGLTLHADTWPEGRTSSGAHLVYMAHQTRLRDHDLCDHCARQLVEWLRYEPEGE